MTQTRSFLLIAWLMLAFFLWDAWQKDYSAPAASESTSATPTTATTDAAIPGVLDSPSTSVPSVGPPPATPGANLAPVAQTVTLANDVLRLTLDARGGTVLGADLLAYRRDANKDDTSVALLSQEPKEFFAAQTGWVNAERNAPNHQAEFRAEAGAQTLAAEAKTVELPFVWTGANGLSVRRIYRLERGSYVVTVRDEVINQGAAPWRGNNYRQLLRVPPPSKGGGLTNPEAYSFVGVAWYSPQDRFEKLAFDDFEPEAPLAKDVAGGWIGQLQHYFLAAWIPPANEVSRYATEVVDGRYLIRAMGPSIDVAPGASTRSEARLYLGPKLQDRLEGIAPGLGLTLDYGIFTILAQPLHWLLAKLHALTGNWGWAIVLLVVLIKLALFKLSEAQYKSFAKMRRVQPRIEALKERYGDDRQKFQMAMMELYKKEKINPMGGCLPILVQIPIFIALYWVLLESVELRHAPWIGWIKNLTAPDPYFVLPAINLATMWLTQKLSPTPGMDPMQKKMMQIMPLVMGVMFAFFPAGLVLYWATNGLLGLLQQWVITKRHGEPVKAPA